MASSVQQKRSSSCVASASQPTPSAQNAMQNGGRKDEELVKLINEWKTNATTERAWFRIQRLGINNKLKKPSEYKPEDFFPKIPDKYREQLSRESTVPDHVNPLKRKSLSKRRLEEGFENIISTTRATSADKTTTTAKSKDTCSTPTKNDRASNLSISRSRTHSAPRTPLLSIPAISNTTPTTFSSPTNRSRSTTAMTTSNPSVNKENNATKSVDPPVNREPLSKRLVESVNPTGAQQTTALNRSKEAAATTHMDVDEADRTVLESERQRRCDTGRIPRLAAPSPILNSSNTTKRIFKQRNATLGNGGSIINHNKTNGEVADNDVMELDTIHETHRVNRKRLNSTRINEPADRTTTVQAFDSSLRSKSNNLSVMTNNVEELMESGGGPLDPEHDELVHGSGDMYNAAAQATSQMKASTSASRREKESVYDFEVRSRKSTASKNATALNSSGRNQDSTRRSTRSTSAASNGNNESLKPQPDVVVVDEPIIEPAANTKPSVKSSILITKIVKTKEPLQQDQGVPQISDDVFVQPKVPPPPQLQPSTTAAASQHNTTATSHHSVSISIMSQTSQRSASSQPMRDDEIDVSVARPSLTASSVSNSAKQQTHITKGFATNKPDESNNSKDEAELRAHHSNTYIPKSKSNKSVSSNSTHNRTVANATVNNTTAAAAGASVLMSNKPRVGRSAKNSSQPPSPTSTKTPMLPKSKAVASSKSHTAMHVDAKSDEKQNTAKVTHRSADELATSPLTASGGRQSRRDSAEAAKQQQQQASEARSTRLASKKNVTPTTASAESTKTGPKSRRVEPQPTASTTEVNAFMDVVYDLAEPVLPASVQQDENINFGIFHDDDNVDEAPPVAPAVPAVKSNPIRTRSTPTPSTPAASTSEKRPGLSHKTNKANTVRHQEQQQKPMTSKQAEAVERAAAAAAPKAKKARKPAKVREEVNVVEDEQDQGIGLRKSTRVKCDRRKQEPRYEWTEMKDFEGKTIMVETMVGVKRKHNHFSSFLRNESVKRRNATKKQQQHASDRGKKRVRSSSRSASPVKKSRTKSTKEPEAPAAVSKEKQKDKAPREKNAKEKRPLSPAFTEHEFNNDDDEQNDEQPQQVFDQVNHNNENDNENVSDESSVELHVRPATKASHKASSEQQTASNAPLTVKPPSQQRSTSNNNNRPTEQASLDDINLDGSVLPNESQEEVYLCDNPVDGSLSSQPPAGQAFHMFCFGKLNSERVYGSRVNDGVYLDIINRKEGVLKIESGCKARTQRHDTEVTYYMQNGGSCVYNINGLFSMHSNSDVITVPQNLDYKIMNTSNETAYVYFKFGQ